MWCSKGNALRLTSNYLLRMLRYSIQSNLLEGMRKAFVWRWLLCE